MDDVSWFMYYAAAACSGISVGFAVWVAYLVVKTQAAIDQLETLVLAVLDDALQIMVPTAVLNHISQYDIANFEMKTEGGRGKNGSLKKRFQGEKGKHLQKDVCYAEDVSQPLSEKSQMYNDFGESGPQRKKLTARQLNQLQATHSIEVLVKSPVKKTVTPARSTTNIAPPVVSINSKGEKKGSQTPETPEKKGSGEPIKSKENKPEPIAKKSQLNLATAKEKPSKEKKETASAQKPGTQTESKEKSKKSSVKIAAKESAPKEAPLPPIVVVEKPSAVKENKKQSEVKQTKPVSKVEAKKSVTKLSKKETGSNQSSTVSEPSKPNDVGGSKEQKESMKPTQMSDRSTFSERTQNPDGEGEKKEEKVENNKN